MTCTCPDPVVFGHGGDYGADLPFIAGGCLTSHWLPDSRCPDRDGPPVPREVPGGRGEVGGLNGPSLPREEKRRPERPVRVAAGLGQRYRTG